MKKNIRLRVKNLIEKHNTSDPFKLCDRLNIIVLYKDLGTMKGYYKKIHGGKVIVINSLFSRFTQKIIAHELGHAILHSSSTVALMQSHILQYSDVIENEANKFAAELLMNGYNTDNIEYCDYYCDEVSDDENDKVLLERLKEIKFSNKC